MAKIEVLMKGKSNPVRLDEKLAKALVRSGRATFPTEQKEVKPEQYQKKVIKPETYETKGIEGLEMDAAGEIYNPEIHTATKLKTKDGLWRKKPSGKKDEDA